MGEVPAPDRAIYGGIERQLAQAIYAGGGDKSFSEKVLASKEIEEIKDIVKKDRLTLTDLRQLRYLLSGTEIKLLSLEAGERYLLCKFLTWVSAVIQVEETQLKNIEIHKKMKLTDMTTDSDNMIYEMVDEETKKMCNTFLSLGRSSLSLEGEAFEKLTAARYEVQYATTPINQAKESGGLLRWPGSGAK